MSYMDQLATLHLDANGNAYAGGDFYNFTSGVANGQVTTGPTYLHRVNVTVAATAGTFTIYDGTSATGQKLGTFDATKTGSFEICGHFKTGIYLSVSGLAGGLDGHMVYSCSNQSQ